jgi:hypothetical protein
MPRTGACIWSDRMGLGRTNESLRTALWSDKGFISPTKYMNWSIGVLEYWSIGVLEYWSAGVLEYWRWIGRFEVAALPDCHHRFIAVLSFYLAGRAWRT